MLVFSLPLVPAAIAGWSLNLSDRYIIGAVDGFRAVGIYSVGYTIGWRTGEWSGWRHFGINAFSHGTQTIARAIAQSPAFSIAGGGDTLAAIAKYGIEKDIGYISTGGGAFLEVLEGKQLPAFEILEKRANG